MTVFGSMDEAYAHYGERWFETFFDPMEIKDVDEEYLATLKAANPYNGRFDLSDRYLVSDEDCPELFTGTANTQEEIDAYREWLYRNRPQSFHYYIKECLAEEVVVLPFEREDFSSMTRYVMERLPDIAGTTLGRLCGMGDDVIRLDDSAEVGRVPKRLAEGLRAVYPAITEHLRKNSVSDIDYDSLYHYMLYEMTRVVMEY